MNLFILFLNKIGKLFEVEESMFDTPLILLFINKVMSFNLLLPHFLSLILTHQLSQSTVEFLHILWKELSVTKDLLKEILLVFFPDKAALDPESLISHLFSTIVEDLLTPISSLLLFLESLDFLVSLLKSELTYLSEFIRVVNSVSLKEHLLLLIQSRLWVLQEVIFL